MSVPVAADSPAKASARLDDISGRSGAACRGRLARARPLSASGSFPLRPVYLMQRALADLDPSGFADALGLVSTLLGAEKDALARRYVCLAADTHAPSLDLWALFAGTDSA